VSTIVVANMYRLMDLTNLEDLKEKHEIKCQELKLRGSVLLATEGFNASLAGTAEAIQAYEDFLHEDPRFAEVVVKKSFGTTIPFAKMVVRIKKHVLAWDLDFELSSDDYNKTKRLSPAQWRKMMERIGDDVILLDTRNDYEFAYGTFEGAEQLNLNTFKDFPKKFMEKYGDKKDKTFLTFCTGGIRCEKVTAFADRMGFDKVYQLEGGIISYFDELAGEKWKGSCYVFDYRWAIGPDKNETGEGHYLEDGFKGTVHVIPEKAIQENAEKSWP